MHTLSFRPILIDEKSPTFGEYARILVRVPVNGDIFKSFLTFDFSLPFRERLHTPLHTPTQ